MNDIMFDVSDINMIDNNQQLRSRVNNIYVPARGHTVKQLFTTANPMSLLGWFIDAEDNSNVVNDGPLDLCNLNQWTDLKDVLCTTKVITFHDDGGTFAIGISVDYVTPDANTHGWRSNPAVFWPQNFRVWVR